MATMFEQIFGNAKSPGGLLGNPAFMVGSGLLSNRGNPWGGAIQGLAAAQGYKLSEAKMKKEEEQEARLKELQDMQMAAAKQAQERQQYTQALLTAGSSQNPGLLQDPAFQSQLRMKAAAYGDPAALQAGGLLQAPQDPMKPTRDIQNFEYAQQNPAFAEQLRAQQQSGAATPYFTPVFTANGVQAFDNRTGMTVPSQGGTGAVPLPSDPAQQAEIVRQKAMAEMNAKFEGEVQTRAPQLMGSVGRLENLIKSVESGDASSGVLVGSVYKLTDPQTAILEAESIAQSVEALNGSGLAPVSNQELKTIREMFASASKTGEINKVLLNRSLQIARKQLATLGAKDAYFQQKKTLEGWRPEGFGAAPVESVVPAPSAAQQSDREARLRALREKHGGV